jgi:trk system potassium uptake protein TrkH
MKVLRVSLLAKSADQELRRQTQPRMVTVLRMGGRVFNENVRGAVLSFFVIYVLLFALGVIVFSAGGLGEVSAIGGVAATLNNVGPGLGDVGGLENFSALSDGGRLMAIFLMLAGRLEIFTVVALLAALVRRIAGR